MAAIEDGLTIDTIGRIYEAALSPRAYERFIRQWDEYLDGAVADADDGEIALHIDQALAIVERLEHAGEGDTTPETYVASLPGPAALIDRTGDIIAANDGWLDHHPAATGTIWPLAADRAGERKIRAAIQEVASAAKLPVHLTRLDGRDDERLLYLSFRRLPVALDGGQQLVCVRSPAREWDDGLESVWAREFDLTPAEIQLLQDMGNGAPFSEIAEKREKSAETVKAQSKSIYRKLGVDNREAAVMLAMRLYLLTGARSAPLTQPKDPARSDYIQLASGLRLAVMEDGHRGRPLLFLHGMTLGYGLPHALNQWFADQGWRLIRIERSGYGRSDPPRSRKRIVEEWIADFPSLLDALGTRKVTLLTHTTGVMYGCAAAAHHPGLVDGIFAISGGVPITDPQMIESYPVPLLRIARTAKASPRAMRFFLSVTANYVTRAGGEDKLIRTTYSNTPVDAAALEDEDTMELTREGMKLVRDGGYHGFIGDARRIFDDWSEWMAALQCPLVYAIGTEDLHCPLDWARAAAQRHPNVFVEDIPGAGQLAQHTHHAEIARLFGEFAGRIGRA